MRQFQKLAHKGARMYQKLQQNGGRMFSKLGVKADVVNEVARKVAKTFERNDVRSIAAAADFSTGGMLGLSANVLNLSGIARGIQQASNKRNYNTLEAPPRQSGDTGPSEFA